MATTGAGAVPDAGWRRLTDPATPTRLRLLALVLVAAIVASGAVAWVLTDRLVGETNDIRDSTGPVLIANQTVLASLAEADTAAAAVHLAGADGNREQRRIYESGLGRAVAEISGIARVLGDDETSHTTLQGASEQITAYAGQVEAARLAATNGLPDADQRLLRAVNLLGGEINPSVTTVTEQARSRLTEQSSSPWYWIAPAVVAAALLVLLVVQVWMSRRFSRLFNVPLVAASIGLLVLVGWMLSAQISQQRWLDDAQDGASTIELNGEIQKLALQHRAGTTVELITGTAPVDLDLIAVELSRNEIDASQVTTAQQGFSDGIGLLHDAVLASPNARASAATAEMLVRWDRYLAASNDLRLEVASGNDAAAVASFSGPSNAAFTGFNTAIESVLFDSRADFDDSVQAAAGALRWLRAGIALLGIAAALLTWAGISQRIQEYR